MAGKSNSASAVEKPAGKIKSLTFFNPAVPTKLFIFN